TRRLLLGHPQDQAPRRLGAAHRPGRRRAPDRAVLPPIQRALLVMKAIPFLDLSEQYRRIQAEIDSAVARTLAGGWYILGEELAAFEREFAAYCGVRHAVGVGSGTEALHLALRACGVQPGDAVITAPNTAVPTVCAIVAANARPVFVDID